MKISLHNPTDNNKRRIYFNEIQIHRLFDFNMLYLLQKSEIQVIELGIFTLTLI